MTRITQSWILAATVFGFAAPGLGEDRENCLYCHQFAGLSRLDAQSGRVRLFYIDPNYAHRALGPHARLACTDCHAADEVTVVPHRPISNVDCARTCHLSSPGQPERRFSHENVARMLEQSVHAPDSLQSLNFTGGPLLDPGQSMCLYCHDEPVFRSPASLSPFFRGFEQAAFDRCDVCHTTQLPVDVEYYLRHVASRLEPARPALELAQVCAVCHTDPRVIADHGLSEAVVSYVRSFHGKAALLGDQQTAGCVSCHVKSGENAHLMLGPDDPRSSVSPANIANACRSTHCHPGADVSISHTAVHLDLPSAQGTLEFAIAVAFIFLTIISFGPSALIVLLELMQLVIGRYYHRAEHIEKLADRILQHPEGRRRLKRFSVTQRIQHWVLTILFVLLCLTGFPMKFAEQAWATHMVALFGGLQTARFVHHWSGISLIVGFVVHLANIFRQFVRHAREYAHTGPVQSWLHGFYSLPIAVNPTDLRRAHQLLAYLVGLRKERPLFGRFTVTEKFEYFGVVWGTTLLGVTGLILWGEQVSSHFVGGRAFNIATIIHTYEAFLAVIHVGILHIYNVVLNPAVFPLSLATLTGHTPTAKLAEENGEFVLEVARDLNLDSEHPEAAESA